MTRRPETSPKVTTVLRFATTTPPIPVTVDTFETRNDAKTRDESKSDDSSAFRDHDPRIPVTVDTFKTLRRGTSPKVTTVLRFATIFVSPACPTLRGRLRTIADDCERLRTVASTNAPTSRRLLDPWTPTLKREPFSYAFGKRLEAFAGGCWPCAQQMNSWAAGPWLLSCDVILGLCRGYTGIMEKNMETTIV